MSSKISVVMPVYNGERYLKLAIDSILHQSYRNFELIIVDDGSADGSAEVIKSYSDPRIVYIKNSENLGLSKSFNIGIKAARGEYIARMDADDISTSRRLWRQFNYLEENPQVGILGSAITLVNREGEIIGEIKKPAEHLLIKWASLFSTPLVHPTIMARASVLKEHPYDETLGNSEDYELWSRLLFKTPINLANLSEKLLYYRTYSSSTTQSLKDERRIISAENSLKNISYYTEVKEAERQALIQLRQEHALTLGQMLKLEMLYFRAARTFCTKERANTVQKIKIYFKLVLTAVFLAKHKIKQYLR